MAGFGPENWGGVKSSQNPANKRIKKMSIHFLTLFAAGFGPGGWGGGGGQIQPTSKKTSTFVLKSIFGWIWTWGMGRGQIQPTRGLRK